MKRISNFFVFFIFALVASLNAQTDSLNIYWDANSEEDMLQYRLYRDINTSNNFQEIQIVPHPTDSQVHSVDRPDQMPGNLYAYKVLAEDSAGNRSDFSETVSVGIPECIFSRESILSNQTTSISLSEVVSDPDNDVSELQITKVSSNQVDVDTSSGELNLTPNPLDYFGDARFTLKVEDPDGFWDQKEYVITIEEVSTNTKPVAQNDEITIEEDSPTTINVLENDSDEDGDELSVTEFWDGDHGDVSRDNNNLIYDPDANFTGNDLFSYVISDGNGGKDTADVSVQVNPANDPPELLVPELFVSEVSDNIFDLKVYVDDPDDDVEDLTWEFLDYDHFRISWENEASKLIKIENLDGTLQESGRFIVSDPAGLSDTAQVLLNYIPGATNTAPSLTNLPGNLQLQSDEVISLRLSQYVVDSTHTFRELSWEFRPSPELSYSYTPYSSELEISRRTEFEGTTSFYIKVSDEGGLSDEKNITIQVSSDPGGGGDDGNEEEDEYHVVAAPNPFYSSQGEEQMVFDNLPPDAVELLIVTIDAKLIYKQSLQENFGKRFNYSVIDNNDRPLSSGVYLYYIRGEGGKVLSKGKFAVVR